ncbi:MAG: amidase [Alphaproteobacteria bacterium]|nr:amidase [Alphaproteobacteria bacterium]
MAKQALSWSEWASTDALGLAELVRQKKITPKEVAAQAKAGIEAANPALEAVLEIFEDVVADPDHDKPSKDGAFYGVPLLLKDIGSGLKGRKQESGTKLLRDFVVAETDPLVENFLKGGLIPIGRSTTPEFGMTFDTTTHYLDKVITTRNPWNLKHTPGGSSGGSAAMVSAGVLPISMASDGGGSTRIPASYCGLVGLKSSRGLVARQLTGSDYSARHVNEGVVTRSVRDTAAALDAIRQGPQGGFFVRLTPAVPSFLDCLKDVPKGWKIGLSTGPWGRSTPVDSQVAARIKEVGKLLESLGHTVEEVKDEQVCDWQAMWRGYMTHWITSRMAHQGLARSRNVDPSRIKDFMVPMVWRHFEAAQTYKLVDLMNAMNDNNSVTRSFGKLMDKYDMLLTPTLAIRVPEANGPYSLLRDEPLETWMNRLADACRFTMPGNETGVPAISVPAGLDNEGLPIGAQLHGKFGRDDMVLQLAAQIEAAKPDWFTARPKNHIAAGTWKV